MLRVLAQRWKQGYRTANYPAQPPKLSPRYLGRPEFVVVGAAEGAAAGGKGPAKSTQNGCEAGCKQCAAVCPTGAIQCKPLSLDLGRCLGCGECAKACPKAMIRFTGDYRMAVSKREDLIIKPGSTFKLAGPLEAGRLGLYKRSLKLRQVSAGGCNACEADANVLGTLAFDMGRFGIQFVASPRHADALLVTGPVSQGMKEALMKTWQALPTPRVMIVSGSCAISGGPYVDHPETNNGATELLPVDLFVPGCPPNPYTLLDGMLRLMGRIQ